MNPGKINLLHLYYLEGNLGDAIRINEMGRWLKKNSSYHALNIAREPRHLFHPKNILTLIKSLISLESKEIIKYRLFINRCILALNRELKKNQYQLIIAETIMPGTAAMLAKTKVKVAVDIHGLLSAEYIENKYQSRKSRKYFRFLKKIEMAVFKKSYLLICVSKKMKDYILKESQTKAKIVIAQNGTSKSKLRAQFHRPLKIIYGGIFAFWEDIDSYLDLAKLDQKNNYFLMGNGPEKEKILKRIKQEKIKISYLGAKKRDEAHQIFSQMSLGMSPTTCGITRLVASPIKVYDYMSLGLPVITAECGDWGDQIKEYQAGFVTQKSSALEFLEKIGQLENREVWQEMSQNALRLATKKSWEKIFEKKLKDYLE